MSTKRGYVSSEIVDFEVKIINKVVKIFPVRKVILNINANIYPLKQFWCLKTVY